MPARRHLGVAVASVAALLAAPAGSAAASQGPALDRSERQVVSIVNRIRAQHGLGALRASRPLARAADAHSRDMLRRDFFAHASSDGSSFAARLHRYTSAERIGENIASVGGSRRAAKRVVRMWMRSAGHREMILTGDFRRIGVGVRTGALEGSRATVFTADFASR